MLTLIASITATTAQPGTEDVPFKADFSQLTNYLKLRASQKKKVKELNESFIQMQKTCELENSSREQVLQQVLTENLSAMKETLYKEQFEKYVTLLNNTNKNKNVIDENLFADLINQISRE